MTDGLSSPYPREVEPTLVIEGDLVAARLTPGGPAAIATVRRTLAVGGRGFLRGAGRSARHTVDGPDGPIVDIRLNPLIARRIYTSGSPLTDEQIRVGMEQLRESDEDVDTRVARETMAALRTGQEYATEQFEIAISDGDELALHRAWEMARKVIVLHRTLEAAGKRAAEARAERAAQSPVPYPGTTRRHAYQREQGP